MSVQCSQQEHSHNAAHSHLLSLTALVLCVLTTGQERRAADKIQQKWRERIAKRHLNLGKQQHMYSSTTLTTHPLTTHPLTTHPLTTHHSPTHHSPLTTPLPTSNLNLGRMQRDQLKALAAQGMPVHFFGGAVDLACLTSPIAVWSR